MGNASTAAAADASELARNAVDCLPDGALADKLASARAAGRQLRVKLGIDPPRRTSISATPSCCASSVSSRTPATASC